MKHVGIYIFLSLFITVTIIRGNEKEITPDSIPEFFLQQQNIFPQEKIYVQTDKSNYLVGDTIWFRAFLVDACMHTLSTLSNFVYADLLDPHNRLVDRIGSSKDILTCRKIYIAEIIACVFIPDICIRSRKNTCFRRN